MLYPRRARPTNHVIYVLASVLIVACDNPAPGEGVDHPQMEETEPTITAGSEAVRQADVPKTDPGTMVEAEIQELLPQGPRCAFAYTAESPPILAATVGGGVVRGVTKIHGRLVPLKAPEIIDFQALANGGTFIAEGVSLTVAPDADGDWQRGEANAERRPANLHFRLEQGLDVAYRGWYNCIEK